MNGTQRSDISIGATVEIVLKKDQRTGVLTEGIVKDILTKSVKSFPRYQSAPGRRAGRKSKESALTIGRIKKAFFLEIN